MVLYRLLHHPLVWSAFLLLIMVTALGAGVSHAYHLQLGRKQQAKQFERMYLLFHSAGQRLQELIEEEQWDQIPNLMRELGKQALAENGEWVLLHRERPVKIKT